MNVQRVRIFDEMLDETYPALEMNGMSFYPSQILSDCDPVAYEMLSWDYLTNLHQDDALTCHGCNYPISKEEDFELAVYPHDGEPIHEKCDTD